MTAHADRQEVKASIDSSCPNEEECGRREAKEMRPSGCLTARPAFPPRLRSKKKIPERLLRLFRDRFPKKEMKKKEMTSFRKSEVVHHAGRSHELIEAGGFGQQLVAVGIGSRQIEARAL